MKPIIVTIALLVSSVASAELYNWSNPSPHHAAVVQVESVGRGGSGAYVEYDGFRFVLTAAHVVGGAEATVRFQTGQTATGKTLRDRKYKGGGGSYDVAAVLIDPIDSVSPVQIASGGQMSEIEICGYGGPVKRLRHYLCRVTDVGDTIFTTNGKVINGDSGGPWFSNGKIVGVSSQGSGEISSSGPYSLFQMSVSPSTRSIQDFVKRVHANHSKLVDS